MNIEKLREEAAEQYAGYHPLSGHIHPAFVAGAKWEHERPKWVNVEDGLPEEHDIFLHRSNVVLCKDDMGKTHFGVYDHKRGIWDTPFKVIRWTEIPKI